VNSGKTIFAQLMDFLPSTNSIMCPTIPWPLQNEKLFLLESVSLHGLRTVYVSREFKRYRGLSSFSPTEDLHMGIRGKVSRNTLAHANQVRDWRIYGRLCPDLITRARRLYAHDSFGVELNQTALCSGLHHDRSLSFTFSMGQIRKRKEL